ncbi:unnamed protein product [Ectocarpus fasciculatus]
MSYVRLLRLPPHSETIGRGAKGWRRHLSTRRPTSGSPSSAEHACSGWHQHRNFRAGSHALGKGGGDNMIHAKTQGLPGMRGYEEVNKNSDNISRNWENENTTTMRGANPKGAALALGAVRDARSSFDHEGALLLRSAHSTGSSPFWGALGNEWDHRSRFAQSQPLRSFASSTPSKPDVKAESSDSRKGTGLPPRQRASLGDLLKPSDKEIEPVKDESAQRFKDLQEEYTLYEAARKDPKQASEQVEQSQMALTRKKAVAMVKKIPVMTWNATKAIVLFLWEIIKNPLVLKDKLGVAQYHLKEFGRHYWLGLKLLWGDIKTAKKILRRILRGFPMTRRERKQLLRTVSDIFRMVPLAAFVLIPFMEFLLPVALKVFPNMLPSTFQDNLKEEEKLKKELRLRMAYAGFLQETVTAMAVKKKTRAEDGEESEATTGELTEFIEKAKMGEITNQDIPKFAKMFKDELTMDNISRSGLVNMCRYMGVPPFGNDNFLRYCLRSKLRAITQDDQRILWEGVSSLTKQELQEACRERGMRATGLTKQGYVRQLSQWLDLSTKKSVPISLLIMSRAFTLQAPDPAKALAQSISAMDDDVVTEVMIEAASSEEQKTPEYRTRKLESLTRQNELIEEENRKREEAEQAQQEAKKAEEASKAEELKAAELKEAGEVGADGVSSNTTAETSEDEAVDKLVEKAAVEAAARTAPGDSLPQVEMQEGQQRFGAASGVEAKKGTEPVTTEADLLAPSTGVGVGDRLVASKPAKSKQSKKASKTRAMNTPKVELDQPVGDVTDAERQLTESKEAKDTAEDGGNKLTIAELAALESLANPSSVEKEKAQLAMMKAALQESLGKPDETERISVETSDASDAEGASKESGPPTSEKDDTDRGAGEQTQPKGKHEVPSAEKPDTLKETAEPPSVAMTSDTSGDGATPGSESAADVEEDGKAEEPAVDKSVERVQTKLASMLNRLELEIQSVEQRIGDKMHVLDRDSDGMVSAEEIAHVVQHVLATKSTEMEAKAIAEDMDTDSDGQISVAELIAWVRKNSEQDAEHVFDEIYQRETKETPTKQPSAKD